MRLATARDGLEPLREARVRRNEVYLSVLLLSWTVTRIGDLTEITPEVIESLYAADFDHLRRFYERVNTDGEAVGVVHCPECANEFEVDLTDIEDGRLGKSTRPSSPECIAETARLAYHLHWPLDTILDLEHRDRRNFLAGS